MVVRSIGGAEAAALSRPSVGSRGGRAQTCSLLSRPELRGVKGRNQEVSIEVMRADELRAAARR